jgi:PAS domain S-box-containing protein
MTWSYQWTPYLVPVLTSAAFLSAIGIYGFLRRKVPGALPLSVLMLGAVPLVLASGLQLASTNDATTIFWFKFQMALFGFLAAAGLWFALEYAGLSKWLTRGTVSLLVIIPVILVGLIATDRIHHLVWTSIRVDRYVRTNPGPAYLLGFVYGWSLTVLQLMAFVWLFIRSPRHRGIVVALIGAILCIRGSIFLNNEVGLNPLAPVNPLVIVLNFALIPYVLAIARFRMFDVAPVARDTIIDRMSDGLIALDAENRIADVNEAAQSLLGLGRSQVIGKRAEHVLRGYPDLLDHFGDDGGAQGEISVGAENPRRYHFSISPLTDRREFQLGRLIWLRDITEQKKAQAQILDQQRTVAMLKERELLARELHDGIGQMLAAAHLKIKLASDYLAKGDAAKAENSLGHLTELTQEAKDAVREYLLGVKSRVSAEENLLAALRHYVNHYRHTYGIHVELAAPPELEKEQIDSTIAAQLQPIVQEALTNVRRHSGASSAQVTFCLYDGEIQVAIEDGGRGFDAENINENEGFGLRSMRGRAETVGGRLEVNSTPGKGTRVVVCAPRHEVER